MKAIVLTGDDDLRIRSRRAELLQASGAAAGDVERFDLTLDGGEALLVAATGMSLFGGPRFLEATPSSDLDAGIATRLAQAADHCDATIVLYGPAPSAATRKALADVATFEAHAQPRTGTAQHSRIAGMVRDAGVTIDAAGLAMLVERSGHNIPRVASVLTQCTLIGLLAPTHAQLAALLGTERADAVPWALTDAIENGDLATALSLADTLDPVAAVSYLGSRTGQLGRIVEDQLRSAEEAASAFGVHTFAARRLVALATRLGPVGVARTWDVIAGADRAVKDARGSRAALEITICQLTALWGPVQGR